jgi:hypothetical protein
LIIGSSHSEGTIFAPPANTTADIDAFMKLQFPALTHADLDRANRLYNSTPRTYPGVNVTESPLFYTAAAMFGDVSLACPTLQFASILSESNVDVYYLRDNIVDPVMLAAGYIVPHTWELQAVWGPEYATNYVALPGANSYDVGGSNRNAVAEVQDLWIRFATSDGSLRDKSYGNATKTPVWDTVGHRQQRLRLQANGSTMEDITSTEYERCAFWASVASRTLI